MYNNLVDSEFPDTINKDPSITNGVSTRTFVNSIKTKIASAKAIHAPLEYVNSSPNSITITSMKYMALDFLFFSIKNKAIASGIISTNSTPSIFGEPTIEKALTFIDSLESIQLPGIDKGRVNQVRSRRAL